MGRQINDVAAEIASDWKNVNYAAKPYLEAMFALRDINDSYMFDSGKSIILYFLANAGSWRGDVARRVKAELRKMVK